MENESKQIALRYKGEDYKEAKADLLERGFTHRGFNEWVSPDTGAVYKFVMSEQGSYVMRVERMGDEGPELINTEFYDHEQAMAEHKEANRIQRGISLDYALDAFKESVLKTTLSKVLRMVETARAEGDPYATALFDAVVTDGRGKLVIKDYLFVDGEVCFYSPTRRTTHHLVTTLEHGGKKLYLYRARLFAEDLLDSLVSKAKLCRIIGREEVDAMNTKAK